MDITDADGLWRIRDRAIEHRRTGAIQIVENIPTSNVLACMNYKKYLSKCLIAFHTGKWPN